MSLVIGIDPGSTKPHGIAIYENNQLTELQSWHTIDFAEWLSMLDLDPCDVSICIEDVKSSNKAYTKKGANNAGAMRNVARSVGMVQQAQTEIERAIEHHGFIYTLHKPSKAWKDAKGKRQFEQVTGWKGRSNEDTRSAAYFGYLGLKSR